MQAYGGSGFFFQLAFQQSEGQILKRESKNDSKKKNSRTSKVLLSLENDSEQEHQQWGSLLGNNTAVRKIRKLLGKFVTDLVAVDPPPLLPTQILPKCK